MENNILSLRDLLDAMVFGMSNIPGFNMLSIPVFISNYLFDLFSDFFLVLTLFALAVMAYDSLRQGKQNLKNDAINLSLIIITVFVILQFKDKSVTYGTNYSYGLVTLYSNLLKKGEDLADALVYSMLYNTPTSSTYSPDSKRPKSSDNLGGIVANNFFSFIMYGKQNSDEAIKKLAYERWNIQNENLKKYKYLLHQDSFDTVLKNTFNFARAVYVLENSKLKPQSLIYAPLGSGVNYYLSADSNKVPNQIIALYNKLEEAGIPYQKAEELIYEVRDKQTVDNMCAFMSAYVPDKTEKENSETKEKETVFNDFKTDKASLIKTINDVLSLNGFQFDTPDCEVPSKIGGKKGLTYSYILQNELYSLYYFWNKMYENLKNYENSGNFQTFILGWSKNDKEEKIRKDKWIILMDNVKVIKEFYHEAYLFVKNNFPLNADSQTYPLIFITKESLQKFMTIPSNNEITEQIFSYKEIDRLRALLKGIWQKKYQIVNMALNKNDDVKTEFFNQINLLINGDGKNVPSYLNAMKAAFVSAKLISPDIFTAPFEVNYQKFYDFSNIYKIVSLISSPYITIGTIKAEDNSASNVINFYNVLTPVVFNYYNKVNEGYDAVSSVVDSADGDKSKLVKELSDNNTQQNISLDSLVNSKYGYDHRVDLIYPWEEWNPKIPLDTEVRQHGYENRLITWVDLGYYFSAIKAYTSNFIIFSTISLSNHVFDINAKLSDNALKNAINNARKGVEYWNSHLSDEAKTQRISEAVANTMAVLAGLKDIKNNGIVSVVGGLKLGGPIWGTLLGIGTIIARVTLIASGSFLLYLILSILVLKFIMIILPAGFWMIAVLNWFFKSAMMVMMLPINVFLLFFKSRRQVFFNALWKLLAQMLTPLALVSTFFVIIVFSVEIDFLLSYFIPFLNENALLYFISDDGVRHLLDSYEQSQMKEAENLINHGHEIIGWIQKIKTWVSSGIAHIFGKAASTIFSPFLAKIIGIIMLMVKTIIVFVIDLHLYMLLFRADDYVREILGEAFGGTTGFDGSMQRVMEKFGANRLT